MRRLLLLIALFLTFAAPAGATVPTPTVGQTVTTQNGNWGGLSSGATYTYQWQDCDATATTCTNIGGATSASYVIQSTDKGFYLRAVVKACNDATHCGQTTSVLTGIVTSGTVFYVSPTGSNANNGTSPSTPWQTIAKVNSTTLTAGQTVLFQGGQSFTGELVPAGSGSSGNPTTYGSYGTGAATITNPGSNNDELNPRGTNWNTYTNLILDCQSSSNSSGVFTFSGTAATHQVLDSLEIKNCTYGVQQQRATDANWTIQNSSIHDINESGIVIGGGSHTDNGGGFVIQNNQIEHTGTDNPLVVGSDAHGIYDDSSGSQILNNDIGDFQTGGVSMRYHNVLIQGNTIHDSHRASCCGMGIQYYNYDAADTPAGTFVTTIRFNKIYNEEYGIMLDDGAYGSATLGDPENWRIYDNTFSGSAGGSGGSAFGIDYRNGFDGTAHSTELRIVNNIFTGSYANTAFKKGNPTSYSPGTYQENFNDWSSTGGVGSGNTGAQDKTSSPNLTAAPGLVPNTGSAMIDAGTSTVTGATFTSDCLGTPLSYCGSAPDMGAVESTGTASAPTTPQTPMIGNASTACNKYASTTGSDSTGTGTLANPYATPQKLDLNLTAGQVGCLQGGTYGTTSTQNTFSNATGVTLTAAPGQAATLNGYPLVTGAGTTISYLNFDVNNTNDTSTHCAGESTGAYSFDIEASNVTLAHSNLYQTDVATHFRQVGIGVGWSVAVTGVHITDNRIHDFGHCQDFDHGVYADNVTSSTIQGNWIYNIPNGAAVQLYLNASTTTVSGNVMDNDGLGVFLGNEAGGNSNNDTITHNTISNTTGCVAATNTGQTSGNHYCTNFGGVSTFWGGTVGTGNTFTANDVFNVAGGNCTNCSGVSVSSNLTSDPVYTNSGASPPDYRATAGAVSTYGLWDGDPR